MQRVVFVQKDVFAKPAVMALSASIKNAGHASALVVADLEKDPVSAVADRHPDVIAFSITTGEYPFMKRLIPKIRKRFKGLIIAGGPHPTFNPDVLNDGLLDAICRGEGDDALPEFLDALDRGSGWDLIPNISVMSNDRAVENPMRDLVGDLDRLPFFDRELYPSHYRLYSKRGREILYHHVVMTGRGCPHSCSFCFNKQYNMLYRGKGKVVRRRSVEHVIRELSQLKSAFNPAFITLDDDNFCQAPRAWFDAFCDAYGRMVAIPFKMNSTPEALTESRVKALKKAGCHAVKMGVESGHEPFRIKILQKNISNQTIRDSAMLLKRYGIRFQTFNMLGLPGETLDHALETYTLTRKIDPDFAWCSLLNPYPGTDIYRVCKDKGGTGTGGYSYFTGSMLDIPEPVIRLQKILYAAHLLRLPAAVVKRLALLPLTRLYHRVFGAGMFWGLTRINRNSFLSILYLSVRYLARYNHEES